MRAALHTETASAFLPAHTTGAPIESKWVEVMRRTRECQDARAMRAPDVATPTTAANTLPG